MLKQDTINQNQTINNNAEISADELGSKKNQILEHGFDLTTFQPGGFQIVLKELGMPLKGKLVKCQSDFPDSSYNIWQWIAKEGKIITYNNPITGEYGGPCRRKPEKDYASYIGIEGESDWVQKVVELIKKYASVIKDESIGKRNFI